MCTCPSSQLVLVSSDFTLWTLFLWQHQLVHASFQYQSSPHSVLVYYLTNGNSSDDFHSIADLPTAGLVALPAGFGCDLDYLFLHL